jgi:hypothetical protein
MRRGALDALRARSAAGRPLYTGAHQVRACTVDWAGELLDSAHAFLQGWDFRERGAAAFYAGLKEVRFMGEFLGHQVCRDLAEEGALSGGRDWCVVGPGARAGLRLLYGAGLPRAAEPAAIAALLETQSVRALVAAGGRRMRAPEAEHALCEFFKYDRIRSSAGFARTKGGPFRPSEEPL